MIVISTRRRMVHDVGVLLFSALLVSSCVDVEGYHLKDDSDRNDNSEGDGNNVATGGSNAVTTTTKAKGGSNAVTTTIKAQGGSSSSIQGGSTSVGGTSQRITTTSLGTASMGGSRATGQCKEATMLTCPEMKTSLACAKLPGCSYSAVGTCTTVKKLTCADVSYSIAECNGLAGCTSTGQGSCVYDTPTCDPDPFYGVCAGAENCPTVTSSYYCEAASNCRWKTVTGSCSGVPTSCSSLLSSDACARSYNCAWAAGTCSGTPTPCAQFTTQKACSASDNCSWTAFSL